MNNPSLIFQCRLSMMSFGYDLTIGAKHDNGDIQVVKGPLVLAPVAPGSCCSPTLNLATEEAVMLMDSLWSAGVRPSNGEGSVGQIGAMREHLDDMRRIVFKGDVNPILTAKEILIKK